MGFHPRFDRQAMQCLGAKLLSPILSTGRVAGSAEGGGIVPIAIGAENTKRKARVSPCKKLPQCRLLVLIGTASQL